MSELLGCNIEELMKANHYCHRCEDEGAENKLQEVYTVEEIDSFRSGYNHYRAIAEKSCDRHPFVWIELSETFYSE